ncbi:MAG: caspase family protein [Bacteroides sp.]|nr:caspase family protein [Bacteroides sp.]
MQTVLEFPAETFLGINKFDIYITYHGKLRDIRISDIPALSLFDLNKDMQTWEQYYYSRRKVVPTYITEAELKKAIQDEVENWQTKGEFESTSSWRVRVNDCTREEFIRITTNKHFSIYEKEQQQIKQEQKTLAQSYEKYKDKIIDRFYQIKIAAAKSKFSSSDFELMPYDADHETFLIHSNLYGDILLPVPIDSAPFFKQNWSSIKKSIKSEFAPNGDDVSLTKLIFTNNYREYREYVYDSHTKANYAITDVKYNFAPIEIADIDVASINIDGISALPVDVSSKVVGKTSSEIITAQNVKVEKVNISASEKSDVDTAIPKNKTNNNTSTFAVIIANEDYHSVSNVPYAKKDGEILEKYLTMTVGLPKDHVKIYKNASFGNMAAAMKHIKNLSDAFGKELNLIFYYTGHGMPNEKTKNPMLIPVDGDAAMPETCYDLDKVIASLGGLKAKSVVVMLDACFSGTERGNGMLMAARGIRIKSNQSEPIGNMVILSASQGDETAYPYVSQQHGLFTYFLIKKLQENKGDVTLGELSDYITEQVKRQSVVSNGKLQTPSVSVSPMLQSSWRNLKLK